MERFVYASNIITSTKKTWIVHAKLDMTTWRFISAHSHKRAYWVVWSLQGVCIKRSIEAISTESGICTENDPYNVN